MSNALKPLPDDWRKWPKKEIIEFHEWLDVEQRETIAEREARIAELEARIAELEHKQTIRVLNEAKALRDRMTAIVAQSERPIRLDLVDQNMNNELLN